MRSAALDRRVVKEARGLVRQARAALVLKPTLRGKNGELAPVTARMEQAIHEHDLGTVRRDLPLLDGLVDELIKRPPKSTTRDYIESIGAAVLIALALRAFVIEAFKIPSSSMYPTLEINDHIFVNKFIYGISIPETNIKLFARSPKRGDVIVFKYPCSPDIDYIKRVVATAGETVEVRCNTVYVDGKPVREQLVQDAKHCTYEDIQDDGRWYTRQCSEFREHVAGHTYDVFQGAADENNQYEDELTRRKRDFPNPGAALPSCSTASSETPSERQLPPIPTADRGKLVVTGNPGEQNECKPHLAYVVPPGHVFVMGDNRHNSNDSRYWGSVPIENIKGKAMFIWLSFRDLGLTPPFGIRWPRVGKLVD